MGEGWQVARTRDDAKDAGELDLLKGNWVLFFSLPEGSCPPQPPFLNSLPKVNYARGGDNVEFKQPPFWSSEGKKKGTSYVVNQAALAF